MYGFAVFGLMSTLLLVVNAWHYEEQEHHHPLPYKFGYKVHDHHTGDHHQQHEESDGHTVKGSYSLKDADGTTRIVEYVAGPHTGFNAVVKRVGHAHHPQHYQHYVHHGGHGQSQGHHGHAQSYSYVGTSTHGGYSHHGGLGLSNEGHHGNAESYIGTTHWGFHF